MFLYLEMIPEIEYIPAFYAKVEAELIFECLLKEIQWKQSPIKIFGKNILEPRLTAWYGEKEYTYSGKTMKPLPWNETILSIKQKIEAATKEEYNSVLLNYYRHGNDSMGWHSDDEKVLGINPIIASLTLGEERVFELRLKADKSVKHKILLENGSLLVMKGEIQHLWQHQLPKSSKKNKSRINLTFRNIRY